MAGVGNFRFGLPGAARSCFHPAVRKPPSFALYWLPVIAWMILIFTGSADNGSFHRSSRILAPLIHFFFPHLSEENTFKLVFLARKCAHLTEYAILAFLVWRARFKPSFSQRRPWCWTNAFEALWVSACYAATDEFHQTFVPSREGCLRDVLIDTTGAAIGLLALFALGRSRKWW
jgi:VanZ family protein